MEIGAQFYTLRDFCQTPEALAESLAKVADIGYKTVQISGTCAFDPAWLKRELDKNGLRCVLTHTAGDRMKGDPVGVAADHDVFGCDYIGLGWHTLGEGDDSNSYAAFMRDYRPVMQAFKAHGKYFMYHNHDHECRRVNGHTVLEQLAMDIPADEMGFTLDTFWIQAGGGDPAQFLEKLSGRIPCIHLKDFAFGRQMAVIGEGNINFDRVFEKAEAGGTRYMLVEQDNCNDEDPFACLKRSFDYLKACGF